MTTSDNPGHGGQAGTRPRVALLITADDELAVSIEQNLSGAEVQIVRVTTGAQALRDLGVVRPTLVIIDLTLPDLDGLVLLGEIKGTAPDLPVIVIGGARRRYEVVLGLRLGADDVVAKPFDMLEFRARVEAVLRRTSAPAPAAPPPAPEPDYYQLDELVVYRLEDRATLAGVELQLTPTEYRVLAALVANPDRILLRKDLVEAVWGPRDARDSRAIDVHIGRLRRKMRAVRLDAPSIVPVRLQAYKITPGSVASGLHSFRDQSSGAALRR